MIVVKIDAVNVILKSVNTVSSIYIYIYIYIFFYIFASHWSTFCYRNVHKNDSELLSSFVQSGTAEAILYSSVFVGCCCCMYFLKIKL